MAKKIRFTLNAFLTFFTLFFIASALADNQSSNHITYRLSYLDTPVQNAYDLGKTIDQMNWLPATHHSVYLHPLAEYSWVKIEITNPSDRTSERLLELATTDIHTADFYQLTRKNEKWVIAPLYTDFGLSKSFNDRPINYRNLVYPVYVAANSTNTYLINIHHDYETKLNIHLWNKKDFYANTTRELVFFGMIYGALIMIAMYNLFIYVSIREKSHLLFALFSAFTGLFIAIQEGHFAQFMANDTLGNNDIFYALTSALMCFFFSLFSIHFLDLERWSMWLMRVMLGSGSVAALVLVFLGLMPASIIFSHYTLCIIISLYGVGIGISLYVWHRGVSSAGFYALAIFLCNIGLMLEFSSHLPLMPWTKLTYSFSSLGNTAMILVFAFAIADKMRLLQKEKLIASMKLVKLTEEKAQNSVETYKAKLHEVELSREANEAKIESRAKSEFLATMSHEIRTPMNGVLGMTELLNDTNLDNKQKHYATSISNSAKALLNAINDLLDFSKIESGKMEFDFRLFNLEKIIDDCISIFALRASESKVSFTGLIQPGTPLQLKGDPEKVRQILLNLLGNAFNFTNKNDISIKAYPTGKATINSIEMRFDIKTCGIVLNQADKDSLYLPFNEINPTDRKHYGHELGLTVSRQLAELMQGAIGVDTDENSTTLWFTARFILPHHDEEKSLPEKTKVLGGRRLLICDNHPAFTDSVKILTESWGMQTSTVNNSSDLIEILLNDPHSYQVLLVAKDLLTPAVQLALRQSNVNHNFITSVIIATQSCFDCDSEEMKKQGIHGVLETPYTTSDLYQSLLKAMGIDNEKISTPGKEKELSVLVAEDNNVNMMVIQGLLRKLKVYPSASNDGKQVFDAYKTSDKSVDLIFMDCEMPEMDGYDATTAIRDFEKQKQLNPVTIIGLSAHSTAEYKERALMVGMNDFFIKPVNIEDIENVLERVRTGYYHPHTKISV
jgi:two-component system, sensor histidine kinase RetS